MTPRPQVVLVRRGRGGVGGVELADKPILRKMEEIKADMKRLAEESRPATDIEVGQDLFYVNRKF